MAPRPQDSNLATWDEHDGRASPSRSLSTANLAEEEVIDDNADGDYADEESGRWIAQADRRRSSVSQRLTAMADIGGVNSFRQFARSWQRAAEFPEVIPRRPSIVYNDDAEPIGQDETGTRDEGEDGAIYYGRSPVAATPTTGLLAQHLEGAVAAATGPLAPDATQEDFRTREGKLLDAEMAAGALPTATGGGGSASSRSSLFAAPHLSSPSVIGSYGSYRSSSQYGTMASGTTRRHRPRASIRPRRSSTAARENDVDVDGPAFGEESPILVVREVKQGDRVVLTVDGQSTLPQSTFNAVNAIIGVGMLSLPLALRLSGWLLGPALLTVTAAVTAHTARLLARCMRRDPALVTYSDLAYVAFGARARVVVAALFTLELLAACVALVILFADSLDLLLPGVRGGPAAWKCVCAALVLVLNTLPLRWLSYTSVVGIFSTFCIVCIVVIDGLVKKETPGSLWEPAVTHLWPSNWLALPLAYGLMASPWGAHSVFPSIYRDMRHPHKWDKAVTITFSFSYVLDTCLAVVGILMFGDGIRDAITSNILRTEGFPPGLTFFMCVCIGIIPLTKIPLSARPLITTADVIFGLHFEPQQQQQAGSRRWVRDAQRASVRVGVVLVLLAISIVFPAFDSVCAFLGAALCTLISIVLPIAFYLKLFRDEISHVERIVSWVIIIVFSILGLIGTACTFLPKSMVDA
ncbi:Amino acid transporter, transmembrane [Cordyceps fumosorosea ARSEF 2679]|uniref:Amino acid transporter, transmembrane n=1 Tax=Cordyceps fumosorosea (strain ARSEF 2679) TaxID=1081104 RepID=A0A167MJS2_CORFA|nr:Amino acid transporter, transmembrane [Cordyceps fumosorosea ARSEF 2679]OAA54441.1 Amino acid transporter, transmembrane [Cordyceps fumosorosea ARSEF 2679]